MSSDGINWNYYVGGLVSILFWLASYFAWSYSYVIELYINEHKEKVNLRIAKLQKEQEELDRAERKAKEIFNTEMYERKKPKG